MSDSPKHSGGSSDGLWDHAPEVAVAASSGKPTDEQWKQIDRLRLSVDESSKYITTRLSTFIILSIYVAITVGNTTDEMLFKRGDLPLPLLGIGLPIVPFYFVLPLFFLLMHMYVIVQLRILKAKLVDFHDAVLALNLTPQQKKELLRLSYPFVFNHLFLKTGENRTVRFIFRFAVVTVLIVLPIVLLLWLQRQFLAIHIETMTWWHRACVLGDLVMLLIYWPRKTQVGRVSPAATQDARPTKLSILLRWTKKWFRRFVVACSILLVISMSLLVLTIPGEPTDLLLPTQYRGRSERPDWFYFHYSFLSWTFDTVGLSLLDWINFTDLWEYRLHRNLDLANKMLVAELPSSEVEAAMLHRGMDRDLVWEKFSKPLTFPNEVDLRYSDLSEVALPDVRLIDARMQYADLFRASFHRANLNGALLYGAYLSHAQMDGAQLGGAELAGTELESTKLPGAFMSGTEFHLAIFKFTDIDGSFMPNAQLHGAYFDGVTARGIDFSGAVLLGATLKNTTFSACDFEKANFGLANPMGVTFDTCNLRRVLSEGGPEKYDEVEYVLKLKCPMSSGINGILYRRNLWYDPLFERATIHCADCLVDDDPNGPFSHCNANNLTEEQFNEKYAEKLMSYACANTYVGKTIALRASSGDYPDPPTLRNQIVAKKLWLAAKSGSCEAVKNLPNEILEKLERMANEDLAGPPAP